MPELPEAETIARGLRLTLPGLGIRSVEVIHADVLRMAPAPFSTLLEGRRFRSVGRRGKNLVLRFDDDRTLVVNLGMSGRLLHRRNDDPSPAPTHPAVRFRLDQRDDQLVYHDVRRFGTLTVLDAEGYRRWSASLGPEPLDGGFTTATLAQGLAASAAPLRSWLLDQRRIAGVGNIYANEACFLARVHPRRRGRSLDPREVRRLHRGLRRILREAVEAGGTTLRDYRTAQGWEGNFGPRLRVYGRDGSPCTRCGTPVERSVFGGRSAFHCPRCQAGP